MYSGLESKGRVTTSGLQCARQYTRIPFEFVASRTKISAKVDSTGSAGRCAYHEETQSVAENEADTSVLGETVGVGGIAYPLVGTAVDDLLVIAGPYCSCEVAPGVWTAY